MRPTQKMMNALALPAPNRKRPEKPETREPGAAIQTELERVERRERTIHEIDSSKKFGQLFGSGRNLVSELAAMARTKKIDAAAADGHLEPGLLTGEDKERPDKGRPEKARPAAKERPAKIDAAEKERLAKIDAAEKEALERWKELEADARKTLELRARRLEAQRKALVTYLDARKRGLGGPTPPPRPQED